MQNVTQGRDFDKIIQGEVVTLKGEGRDLERWGEGCDLLYTVIIIVLPVSVLNIMWQDCLIRRYDSYTVKGDCIISEHAL